MDSVRRRATGGNGLRVVRALQPPRNNVPATGGFHVDGHGDWFGHYSDPVKCYPTQVATRIEDSICRLYFRQETRNSATSSTSAHFSVLGDPVLVLQVH